MFRLFKTNIYITQIRAHKFIYLCTNLLVNLLVNANVELQDQIHIEQLDSRHPTERST